MTLQTQPIVFQPIPVELSEKQQAAWLAMAKTKNVTTNELAKTELEAQQILINVKESGDYKVIDEALAKYRKISTDIVEKRKPFTNAVNQGITQPLMAFEKRVDPAVNVEYATLSKKSLELRKKETDDVNRQNVKNQTIANFKAHVANEFYRVGEILRTKIRTEIYTQYKAHLDARISPELDAIKEKLTAIEIPPMIAFAPGNTNLNGQEVPILTREEMASIFAELNKPNLAGNFKDAEKLVDETFVNFESDLANVAQATAHAEQKTQLANIEDKQTTQTEQSVSNLVHSSSAPVIEAPKIIKKIEIVEEDTEEWFKKVASAFIVNLPNLQKYLKVKKWSNLSVGQMADYLAKYCNANNTRIIGLQYNEIEK